VRVTDSEVKRFKLTNLPSNFPDTETDSKFPSDTFEATFQSSQVYVDIIKFYNTVFLDDMESYLCDLENDESLSSTSSAVGFAGGRTKENDVSRSLDLRTASPFNLRTHKSPQKIRTLTVSPRRTPLLLRERSNMKSVVLGTPGASPRRDFSMINQCLNNVPSPGSGDLNSNSLSKSRLVKRQLSFETSNVVEPITTNNCTTTYTTAPNRLFTSPEGHTATPTDMDIDQDVKKSLKRPREQTVSEPNKKPK